MFGKGLSIRERFANIRMDYLDNTNLSEESRWSNRLTFDGSWENNLYNFIKRVLPKLVINLKRPFKLDGMVRVDDTSAHKAVREAAVNMIIHVDYHSTGVLKVIKFDDGFLFSNLGNLKLPVQAIYEGGHSVARNPKIQKIVLATAYLEDKVSNSRLQSVLGLHSTEVGKILYNLVDKNLLQSENRGRWTTYHINMDLLKDYGQYWFVTITPYGKDIGPAVPDKPVGDGDFKKLSGIVGMAYQTNK